MFSHNQQISTHQVVRLLIFDIFICAALYLPKALARTSSHEILASVILGILIIWGAGMIYVAAGRRCGGAFVKEIEHTYKSASPAVTVFYGFRCLLTFSFMFYVFIKALKETFLYSMPSIVMAAAMILVLIYACHRGIEVRARLSEILFYLILIPIICISLFSLPEADFSRLIRVDGFTGTGLLKGALTVAALFSPVEWFLFTNGASKGKHTGKGMTAAVFTGGGLVLLITALCVCVLTPEKMGNEAWPAVLLMQIVRIPGGFMSRQDGLMLSFWIFGMFMSLSGALVHSSELFRFTVKRGRRVLWLAASAVIGGAAALIAQNGGNFDEIYFNAILITWPLSLLLAVFTGRGKKQKERREAVAG